ncbi:MAG: hypothetical protein V3S29_06475, partial [bacterium]
TDPTEFEKKTEAGGYHIDVVNLNRPTLKRLREYRARLHKSRDFIAFGVRKLRGIRADNLPKTTRAPFIRSRDTFSKMPADADRALDWVLKDFARSPLLPDPEIEERTTPRRRALHSYGAILPSGLD